MSKLDTILFLTYIAGVLYMVWLCRTPKRVKCACCGYYFEKRDCAKFGGEYICDRCVEALRACKEKLA